MLVDRRSSIVQRRRCLAGPQYRTRPTSGIGSQVGRVLLSRPGRPGAWPWTRLNPEQEIRRRQNRLQRQSNAFLERVAFLLRQGDQIELRLQLFLGHRAAVRALHQAAQNCSRALRRLLIADEDPGVARGWRRARVERTDDIQVVHEEAAPHIRVDVLARIGKVRELRIRRPQEPLAGLHRRTCGELALRISERSGALDDRRDDGRAVDRQHKLARRRGFPRRLVAGLQLFRRGLAARRSTRSATTAWRQRGPRGGRRSSGLLALEPPLFEELPALLGPAGSFFIGNIRVVAAEIRDPQAELVLTIHRKGVVAVHRAAQRIRQVNPRIAFRDHRVVRVLRTPVHHPHQPRRFGRQRLAIHGETRDLFRRLHVLLHEERRDREDVAVVVEPVTGIIDRELVGGPRRDPEQVADGVVVFDAIQAPRRHTAGTGTHRQIGPARQSPRPVDDGVAIGLRQRRRRRGRHRTGRDLFQNSVPDSRLSQRRRGILERFEAERTRLGAIVMTADAASGDDRKHLLLVFLSSGLWLPLSHDSLRRQADPDDGANPESGKHLPRHQWLLGGLYFRILRTSA